MALTDTAIRNAKAGPRPRKLTDGGGLYLLVTPCGTKLWRFRCLFEGKDSTLALGSYPAVPLAGKKDKATGLWIDGARDRRNTALKLLAQDLDPATHRRTERLAKNAARSNSLEAIAREWYTSQKMTWAATTAENRLSLLEKVILRALGNRPIHETDAPALLKMLR